MSHRIVFGILALVFGLVGIFKTGWMARLEKGRRATMSNLKPRDIELNQTRYDLHHIAGAVFVIIGLATPYGGLV